MSNKPNKPREGPELWAEFISEIQHEDAAEFISEIQHEDAAEFISEIQYEDAAEFISEIQYEDAAKDSVDLTSSPRPTTKSGKHFQKAQELASQGFTPTRFFVQGALGLLGIAVIAVLAVAGVVYFLRVFLGLFG